MKNSRASAESGHSGEKGTSSLELALVLPMFLMLIVGSVDFGRAIVLYNMASQAARDGARAAQVMVVSSDKDLTGDQAQIKTAALLVTSPLEGLGNGVTVTGTTETDASGFYYVKVIVRTTYEPVAGQFLGLTSIPIGATSRLAVPCGKCA